MNQTTPAPQEGANYFFVLRPHRSLSPAGFLVLMAAIGLVAFTAGFAFFLMGAWPVVGFFGLDALLIYLAFHFNFRAARAYETVDVNDSELTVTRVTPSGRSQSWSFNPYWVQLALNARPGRVSELSLRSHGRKLVIGAFLPEEEKKDFADALEGALASTRRPHRFA